MNDKSNWILLATLLQVLAVFGCQAEKAPSKKKKKTASSTATVKRREIDLSHIVLPKGFPEGISLYKVGWVGDQYDEELDENNEQYGNVTWDTSATVTEARDFYAKEFESRKLNPLVSKLTDMPGENYLVRYLDKEQKKIYSFSCGQRTKGGTVKCFITSRSVDEKEITEFESETSGESQ